MCRVREGQVEAYVRDLKQKESTVDAWLLDMKALLTPPVSQPSAIYPSSSALSSNSSSAAFDVSLSEKKKLLEQTKVNLQNIRKDMEKVLMLFLMMNLLD